MPNRANPYINFPQPTYAPPPQPAQPTPAPTVIRPDPHGVTLPPGGRKGP